MTLQASSEGQAPAKKPVHLPENIKPRPLKADKRGRVRKIKNDPRYVKYF